MAAGLAHELNNPSTAIQRAAKLLADTFVTLQRHAVLLNTCALTANQLKRLTLFQQTLTEQAKRQVTLFPLEVSDREEALGSWLDELAVANAWTIAPTLVAAQVTQERLQPIVAQLPADRIGDVLTWLHEGLAAGSMLREIEESGSRISQLVASIKKYTYMIKGEIRDWLTQRGLDNTLKILGHKLRDVTVSRHYDPNLPHILAGRGGELNQVWTDLIDNAADALHEKSGRRAAVACHHTLRTGLCDGRN